MNISSLIGRRFLWRESFAKKAVWFLALVSLLLGYGVAMSESASAVTLPQVSVGYGNTCVVVDGGLECLGYNSYGQIGEPSVSTSDFSVEAVKVFPAGSKVTQVSSGTYHTCAVVDGGVKCWGYNNHGQLGDGTKINSSTPVAVAGLTGVSSVSAGTDHTCAVFDGGVMCWGANSVGQLGDGTTVSRSTPVAVNVAIGGVALSGVSSVSVGVEHTCAVVSGGVMCWGGNWGGQLGDGTDTDRSTPVAVVTLDADAKTVPLSGVSSVSGGSEHTCAVVDGGVMCWGANSKGQLGQLGGVALAGSVEILVGGSPLTGVASVSVTEQFTCAVLLNGASGKAACWGQPYGGSPMPVSEIEVFGEPVQGFTSIAAGWEHSCGVIKGEVSCWGSNEFGQLGAGMAASQTNPIPIVPQGSSIDTVQAGAAFTCAQQSSEVFCIGANFYGQLGDGTTVSSSTPVAVVTLDADAKTVPLSGVSSFSAGDEHTCAVLPSGVVKCWGYNMRGQLGDGTKINSSTAVAVVGLTGATSVSVGTDHTCAVVSGGVMCWGSNGFGQLGDGTKTERLTPVAVVGLTGATSVSAGRDHTCAVVSGGVKCWGANWVGQLGDGKIINSSTPVAVVNLDADGTEVPLSGATSVSAGPYLTCAVVSGVVVCWGANWAGQLGDGTTVSSSTAVAVVNLDADGMEVPLSGATSVSVGLEGHTCAGVSGGVVKCWGANWGGQLGDGTIASSLTPVAVVNLAADGTEVPLSGATSVSAGREHTCAVVDGGVQCWGFNGVGALGFSSSVQDPTVAIRFSKAAVVVDSPATPAISMQISGLSKSGVMRVISGSWLQHVSSATVNGVAVVVSNATYDSVQISVPELPVGSYDIVLTGAYGTVTLSGGLVIEASDLPTPIISTVRASKNIVGFAGGSAVLSAVQKKAIKVFASKAKTLVCVGGVSSVRPSAADRKLAVARAKAACVYAKKLSPGLVTSVSSSVVVKKGAAGRAVSLATTR